MEVTVWAGMLNKSYTFNLLNGMFCSMRLSFHMSLWCIWVKEFHICPTAPWWLRYLPQQIRSLMWWSGHIRVIGFPQDSFVGFEMHGFKNARFPWFWILWMSLLSWLDTHLVALQYCRFKLYRVHRRIAFRSATSRWLSLWSLCVDRHIFSSHLDLF